jgi:hypothetical protein
MIFVHIQEVLKSYLKNCIERNLLIQLNTSSLNKRGIPHKKNIFRGTSPLLEKWWNFNSLLTVLLDIALSLSTPHPHVKYVT